MGVYRLPPHPQQPKPEAAIFASERSAALTGTILSSTTESDIVSGGKTLIITLTNDTWIPA